MDQLELFDLAFNILYCPVCGSNFDKTKVKLAGQVDDKYIVQTGCQAGHSPIQATLLVAFEQKGAVHPIVNYDDALDIKNVLTDHRGNIKPLIS
ncbi:hypothetical protein HYZ64_02460 [Candidatus Berkelbacteria bacterium]|nr:hypothetical protein [Candidatus Berkelbacteria bacterium]